jgi:hypothetical protein
MSMPELTVLVEQSAKYAGAYDAVIRVEFLLETEPCIVLSNFGTLNMPVFMASLERLLADTNGFPGIRIVIRVDDRGYIIISFHKRHTTPPSTTDYLFVFFVVFILVALCNEKLYS